MSGSLHATTADYLTLEDGGRFGADVAIAANTTLTLADPASFGFLDATVADLSVQESVLAVNTGESLTFVGGDIEISGGPAGFLFAPGGDVNLVSVASAGEATIGESGIDITTFPEHGDISITNDGFISVSEAGGAGSVYIRGGNLLIEDTQIFAETFGTAVTSNLPYGWRNANR